MNVDFDINNLDFYEDKLVILQIYAFDKKHGSHIIRQLLKGTVKWWVGCAKAGIADSIRRSYEELKSIDEGYLMTHALDVEKKMMMICIENARLEGIV